MSTVNAFAKKVKTQLKARPILPFGAPIRIGSIGVMESDQFTPRGDVKSILGVAITPKQIETGKKASWQLTSGKDVKISFLADGEASALFPKAPEASAKIELSFAKKESFLVSVNDLTISRLADPNPLITAMLGARQRGTWRDEYVVIYEVMTPTDTVVLLSRSAQSGFLLGAKANVQAPQGTADIAAKFELRFQNQDAIHFNSGGQPLFFNAYRVKKSFWTGGANVVGFAAGRINAAFVTI